MILNRGRVGAVARYDNQGGGYYFENQALHYLCRPIFLEDLSVREFYEMYQTVPSAVNQKRKQGGADLKYLATSGPFQHPSCHKHKQTGILGGTKQAEKLRDERGYVKVPQFMFPDASKFGGNILNCPVEDIMDKMETYSEAVLTLFMPFCTLDDFQPVSAGILNPIYPFACTNNGNEMMMHD
jgi:hypothetical protein